jgi:hypothetical protein
MVSKHSIENFVKRAIWKLTRSGDLIKYVPKSIHNGVVVGDCAVIRNKKHTFDVYSKNRKPIKKDVCNHKVAICIATIMNQYKGNLQAKLIELTKLDNNYAIALGQYHRYKAMVNLKPHLTDDFEHWEEEIIQLSNKIDAEYTAMTL